MEGLKGLIILLFSLICIVFSRELGLETAVLPSVFMRESFCVEFRHLYKDEASFVL